QGAVLTAWEPLAARMTFKPRGGPRRAKDAFAPSCRSQIGEYMERVREQNSSIRCRPHNGEQSARGCMSLHAVLDQACLHLRTGPTASRASRDRPRAAAPA